MIPRLATFIAAAIVLVAGVVVDATAAGAPKDIVLVLDNSGSMKKNDPEFLTGVAVREFLDRLEGDNRVAILLFDQNTRLVMPLTPLTEETRPDFLLSLDKVDYRGLLTDSPAAIERAIYELKVNGRLEADKSIIFMTDGIVDTGDKAMDVEKSRWLRDELAGEAADENIRIFGIAFTENADFLLIQSLSKRTSGEYFRAYSASDIDGVFRRMIQVLDRPKVAKPAPAPPSVQAPPAVTLPEPAASSLPEITQPEPSAGAAPALPKLPEPGLPTIEQETPSVAVEPALPSLPETSASEPTGAAELPTLPLPQLDTATGEAATAESSGEGAPSSPETAPAGESQQQPEPTAQAPEPSALPAPAPVTAPAPPPSSPLPILIAVGVGLIVLVAAVLFLLKRKAGKRAPAEEQIPKAFLNDLSGVSQEQSYELNDRLTVIGRLAGSDADSVNYVVIPEPTIGRRHAMIEYKDHSFWVIDQNSLNGTFVNNKRIDADTRLKHGDRIRFHKHEFEFLLLDMFETDRTMMSNTMFAGVSKEDDQDITRARPLSEPDEDPERTTATGPETK